MNQAMITLGHGSGGKLTRDLVEQVFVRRLANPLLTPLGDAALLDLGDGKIAMTTDGFVVSPLFFAGGDIGSLAVNGTVNDLAVSGAVPAHLSAAFILEEGVALEAVERIASSLAEAARAAGVTVVTGDTKVVERGHGDGVFVVTTGVGRLRDVLPSGPATIEPGDALLVSGPVGDHGAVIAAHRSGLELAGLASDCAPVTALVDALWSAGVRPRFMRDPTRGGLITVLAECARDAGLVARLREADLPVHDGVRGVCDILGLDPLYLACEGRLVLVVPAPQAAAALAALRSVPAGARAAIIGAMDRAEAGPVVLTTRYGGTRLYDLLASDQLPRIC